MERSQENVNFRAAVIAVTRNIPRGQTCTYKDIAILAGREHAARAVGAILKTNFDPTIPCHRVIRSDGKIGGYNRGAENKVRLLQEEGAII